MKIDIAFPFKLINLRILVTEKYKCNADRPLFELLLLLLFLVILLLLLLSLLLLILLKLPYLLLYDTLVSSDYILVN